MGYQTINIVILSQVHLLLMHIEKNAISPLLYYIVIVSIGGWLLKHLEEPKTSTDFCTCL